MKSFFKFLFSVYLVLGTGAYIISCMAPFINPTHSGVLYFSGLAYPFIFLSFFFIAGYMSIVKKKFIFLFLLIPGILFGLKYIALGSSEHLHSDQDINVYTVNAFSTTLLHENEKTFNAWNTYTNASENQPDIICVQELPQTVSNFFPIAEKFNVFSKSKSNLKIATHYTILSGGDIKDEEGLRFAIYADILINGDTVRVYNFHLYSNKISAWLTSADKTKNPGAGQLIEGSERIKERIFTAAKRRAIQAKKLKWHLSACEHAVIVCGDMNETPQTFVYQQIKSNLYDTFRKGPVGLHPTYRKNPSWVRIDYIFNSDDLTAQSYDVLPYEISDHSVVKAVLHLKED